jgi:hypothetical protein
MSHTFVLLILVCPRALPLCAEGLTVERRW